MDALEHDTRFSLHASIGAEGYETAINVGGRHKIVADEPVKAGGADEGPDPYDLLLASLAACKLITVRMYADRKGWPLEGARARLGQRRIHAEDCAQCESDTGWVHEIDVELEFSGALTNEQRDRLLEISDRCPVHRTLTGEIIIRSSAADA